MGIYTNTQICRPSEQPLAETNPHGAQLTWLEAKPHHAFVLSMLDADYLRGLADVALRLADELDDRADREAVA